MTCPMCRGKGGYYSGYLWGGAVPYQKCSYCHGHKTVSIFHWVRWWVITLFGEHIKIRGGNSGN